MAGEIIRLGDTTSHNGTVVEGSQTDICMGKPIAYLGHKVHCPKCKGDFPIIEGVPTTTFFGKGVALAGMKTSCGAMLIASQFTDTVEWGGGASFNSSNEASLASKRPSDETKAARPITSLSPGHQSTISQSVEDTDDAALYDEQFQLKDDDDLILAGVPYTLLLASGQRIRGVTDEEGRTERYRTQGAEYIEVCLGHIDS
jgi:uncharacterized Zn-binding protein involved in type VI secretion